MKTPLTLALLAAPLIPFGTEPSIGIETRVAAPSQDDEENVTEGIFQHALFGRMKLEEVGECEPFELLLEPPRRPDPEHAPAVEALFAPWLAELGKVFLEDYVHANKLERKAGPATVVLIVCGKVPSYRNASRYEEHPTHLSDRVLWVADPGVLVTQWDAALKRVPEHVLRQPVLRRAVEALLAAYHTGEGWAPKERWVVEGLAEYLSAMGEDSAPSDLSHPAPHPAALERTRAFLSSPESREAMLLPLAELMQSADDTERAGMAMTRASGAGVRISREAALDLYRDQAALWMHFLHRGRGGRYLPGFRGYVAKVLHDNGGPDELQKSLGLTDLAELESEFLVHLNQLVGGDMIPSAVVEVPEEGKTVTASLLLPAVDDESRLAAALGTASLGNLDRAVLLLEAAISGALDPDARERAAEERDRMITAREARDDFLKDLVGAKRRLRLTVEGESVPTRVTGYADGVLQFDKNKAGIESLPVAELSPGDLARSIGSLADKMKPSWFVPYLLLLAGDEDWDKKLDRADSGAAALTLAVAQGMPRLLHEGSAMAGLGRLARTPLPGAPFEAEAVLASMRELMASHGDTRTLPAAREGLRELGGAAYGVLYGAQKIEELLRGKFESLPDGRAKLTYEFEDASEARDFAPLEAKLDDPRVELFPLPAGVGGFEVRDGGLVGEGRAVVQLAAAFAAPLTLTYELVYEKPPPGRPMNASLMVAICYDGLASYVGARDLFKLEAQDPLSEFERTTKLTGIHILRPGKTEHVELQHTGEKARMTVEGDLPREVMAGPRTDGAIVIWVHSEMGVHLKRLEIVGRLTGAVEGGREAWIQGRLGEMGL